MGRSLACVGFIVSLFVRISSTQASTVAYWRFEEGTANTAATGTGTILDSSGNNNKGTPVNGPVYSSNVPASTIPQTGATDSLSMSFNGTNQSLFIPDNSDLALTQSLTLEAYIDPVSVHSISGSPTDSEVIVFRGDTRNGLDPYKLYITHGNLTFTITDASNDQVSVDVPFSAVNKWTEVAGTLNNATGVMDLYENGILVANATTTVRPFSTLDSSKNPGLGIGNVEASDNEFFDGSIDEVKISDQALLPGQLLSSVPEPASFGLLAIGLAGCVVHRKRS